MLSESWVHARFSGSARQLLLGAGGAGSRCVWASGIALPRRCAGEKEGEGYQAIAGVGTHDMLPLLVWRSTPHLRGESGASNSIWPLELAPQNTTEPSTLANW